MTRFTNRIHSTLIIGLCINRVRTVILNDMYRASLISYKKLFPNGKHLTIVQNAINQAEADK